MSDERELDALWIELAELQGWTSLSFGRVLTAHVLSGYHPLTKEYKEVPNWPRDDGAALALCVKFAAGLWEIYICPAPDGERCAVALVSSRGRVDAFGATPAEALARLALAGMRGE